VFLMVRCGGRPPEVRGRGAGRRLLQALSAGYREVSPYNDNPYAAHWFEKRVKATRPVV